jgi:uncharacterized membrane protein
MLPYPHIDDSGEIPGKFGLALDAVLHVYGAHGIQQNSRRKTWQIRRSLH